MMFIIVGLIAALIVVVVVVNAVQQHKEKQRAEKRKRAAKQKAIIDETEEIILNMSNLPANPKVIEILNRRCLNAAKNMASISPDPRLKNKINELDSRLQASVELAENALPTEEKFMLPDNEQHLVSILQTIKKLRIILKSEQSKGVLDAQSFMVEDLKLESMQLKISVESLMKRANLAFDKEMIGSSRQYFEKALQSLDDHPHKNEYVQIKQDEIHEKLDEISSMLKTANAHDRAKKAKAEEDDLDLLFQPKKKW